MGSLGFRDATSHIVPFDRDKLFLSMYEACGHRQEALRDAVALVETVIGQALRSSSQRGLITRHELIVIAYHTLKRFDSAAAVHYGAYHKSG